MDCLSSAAAVAAAASALHTTVHVPIVFVLSMASACYLRSGYMNQMPW